MPLKTKAVDFVLEKKNRQTWHFTGKQISLEINANESKVIFSVIVLHVVLKEGSLLEAVDKKEHEPINNYLEVH